MHDSRSLPSLPSAGMEEINDRWGRWLQFRFKAREKEICGVGGRGQDNKLAMMMVRLIYENGKTEVRNKEYDESLSASEDICARRSIVDQCRSAIKCLLTEHHNKTATEATKKCTKGWWVSLHAELADCLAWLLECLDTFFSRTARHLLLLCSSWNGKGLHVWRLYRSSATPKQTTPTVSDSSSCVSALKPLSLSTAL